MRGFLLDGSVAADTCLRLFGTLKAAYTSLGLPRDFTGVTILHAARTPKPLLLALSVAATLSLSITGVSSALSLSMAGVSLIISVSLLSVTYIAPLAVS